MPTYEYACDACEHRFEEYQSISARPLKKCPVCGRPRLRRLLGVGGGVIFKGSGFYQTDYRSESYKKAAEADKPASMEKAANASGSETGAAKSDGATKTDGASKAEGTPTSTDKSAKLRSRAKKPAGKR